MLVIYEIKNCGTFFYTNLKTKVIILFKMAEVVIRAVKVLRFISFCSVGYKPDLSPLRCLAL